MSESLSGVFSFSKFAAKSEKLEIVKERGEPRGRAAITGAFPRRRRRRKMFELISIYAAISFGYKLQMLRREGTCLVLALPTYYHFITTFTLFHRGSVARFARDLALILIPEESRFSLKTGFLYSKKG